MAEPRGVISKLRLLKKAERHDHDGILEEEICVLTTSVISSGGHKKRPPKKTRKRKKDADQS